jgi:hypothetical protein
MYTSKDSMWRMTEEIFWVRMEKWTRPELRMESTVSSGRVSGGSTTTTPPSPTITPNYKSWSHTVTDVQLEDRQFISNMRGNGMEMQALYLYLNSEFCAQALQSPYLATVDVARWKSWPTRSGSLDRWLGQKPVLDRTLVFAVLGGLKFWTMEKFSFTRSEAVSLVCRARFARSDPEELTMQSRRPIPMSSSACFNFLAAGQLTAGAPRPVVGNLTSQNAVWPNDLIFVSSKELGFV